MVIRESIEEIIEKHNKKRLTYNFGVIPLIFLVVCFFIYENQIVRTEKKFEIIVNVNSTNAKIYKVEVASQTKFKKTDIIANIELGNKIK